MHLKRWLTGIIAIPILVYIISPESPRWILYTLLWAAAIISLMEFYHITTPDLPGFVKIASYGATFLFFLVIYREQYQWAHLVLVLFAFVSMTFFMITTAWADSERKLDVGRAVLGPIYIGIPLSMMMQIDQTFHEEDSVWLFFLLVVIFASDTGAFYCGKLFGRHKLYEAVSPNKTWEGAIGGVFFSMGAGLCLLHFLAPQRIGPSMFFLMMGLSVAGQIGDLVESMLKRHHGTKDSGRLLPGHGGMLDRIDGLLFAIPVLFVYLHISIF